MFSRHMRASIIPYKFIYLPIRKKTLKLFPTQSLIKKMVFSKTYTNQKLKGRFSGLKQFITS